MSAIAEAVLNLAAETLSHMPVRTPRRIAAGALRIPALVCYGLGRALLRLFRAPRSQTGVPEAVVGCLIVMGLFVALVKLPLRLLLATLMR